MRTLALLALLPALVAEPAAAQSTTDIVGYIALNLTPAGALAPLPGVPLVGAARRASIVALRYGHMGGTGGDVHTGALTLDGPAGTGRLAVTLGYIGCGGCDGSLLGGVEFAVPVVDMPVGAARNSFSLSIAPAFGVGRTLGGGEQLTSLTGSMSLPMALSANVQASGGGPRLVAFVAPGVGLGYLRGGGDSENGTRLMLGGGVAVADLAPGLALHVGVQKVFITTGRARLGAGLSWSHGR